MTATFFGHKDTPKETEPTLRTTLVNLIENHGATEFYVGNNGNFDKMVRHQLEELSQAYHITYSVVLAYLPTKKSEYDELANTILPEGIEAVPERFAISYRNKWMLEQSDTVVSYVIRTYGGAAQFKEMAERQGKTVVELSK